MERIRKDALAKGDEFYKTGKPCKHGHTVKRKAKSGKCTDCEVQARLDKRDYHLEYARQWQADNKEHYLAYQRNYHRTYRKD